jgi:hypothetical protein
MTQKEREIDPTQAREKVQAGRATLVCAYDDETKCRKLMLDDAISMTELRRTLPERNKDEELILYCA